MSEAPVEDYEWQEMIYRRRESIADHRLALLAGKYLTPLLMAIVTGLFVWVWQTSTEVTELRERQSGMNKRFDELRSGIGDRSTQPQANDVIFAPEKWRSIYWSDL